VPLRNRGIILFIKIYSPTFPLNLIITMYTVEIPSCKGSSCHVKQSFVHHLVYVSHISFMVIPAIPNSFAISP
jgi:hypothetical protein